MRYHFHVDDHLPNNDADGTELATLEDVEREICRLAGQLLVDGSGRFWPQPAWRIRVTDAADMPVLTLLITGVRGSAS